MKFKVSRTDVWAASIDDRPGALADMLAALAAAGANLGFLIARRTPEQRNKGVVFVTPIKGAKQVAAARKSGFRKTESLHSVCIEGADKPGAGAAITRALAQAGINLRGLSAAAIGRQFITHLALDSAKDAAKTIAVVRKLS